MSHPKRKIGIIGYGSVGRFLCHKILFDPTWAARFALAFAYNRTPTRLAADADFLPKKYWLTGADAGAAFSGFKENGGTVDLVVEVSHPSIVRDCGVLFLENADFMPTSLTALADPTTEALLRSTAADNARNHGLYLPTGAAWGVQDIAKMSASGALQGLAVSMSFHADALRLEAPLQSHLAAYQADTTALEPHLLYSGPVRGLAPLAPNNVNTMVCLALAGANIGLDGTQARLFAHKTGHAHRVEIAVMGPNGFQVKTTRINPAQQGAVTGAETYRSFLMSLQQASGQGRGVHFC